MLFRKSKKPAAPSPKPPQDAELKQIYRHLGPAAHHGIPGASLRLAFDPVQGILAIGTLDGRIKLIGNNGVEGILVCASQSRCKYLEFANNQGFLVQVTAENDLQIWDLERRELTQEYRCNTSVTAFAMIQGSPFMYVGEDSGDVSILEYDKGQKTLRQMPYRIDMHLIYGDKPKSFNPSVIGILPYPDLFHSRVLIAYSDGLIAVWSVLDSQMQGTVRVSGKEWDSNIHSSDEEAEEKDICCICWADLSGNILAVGYIDGDLWLWDLPLSINSFGESSALPFIKLQLSPDTSKTPILALNWCAGCKRESTEVVGGHLFVYGGRGVGCSEALTVYSLKSANGQSGTSNVRHIEIPLLGPFEDMILLPKPGTAFLDQAAALLVLTSPGQLFAYDEVCISKGLDNNEESSAACLPEPVHINPFTTESDITVMILAEFSEDAEAATILCQLRQEFRGSLPSILPGGTKWPVTGGFLNKLPEQGSKLSAVLFTGHLDGSVNVWNASTSVFRQICNLPANISPLVHQNTTRTAVSHIEFCSKQGILLVAQDSIMVSVYKVSRESDDVRCILCNSSGTEDQLLHQNDGFHCLAILDIGVRVTGVSVSSFYDHVAIGYEDGTLSIIDVANCAVVVQRKAALLSEQKVIRFVTFGTGTRVLAPSDQNSVTSSGRIVYVAEDSSFAALVYSSADLLTFGPWHFDGSPILRIDCLEINDEQGKGETACQSSEKLLDEEKCPQEVHLCPHYLLVTSESSAWLYQGLVSNQASSPRVLKAIQFTTPCLSMSMFFCQSTNSHRLVLLQSAATIEVRSIPGLEVVQQFSMDAFYTIHSHVSENPTLICGDLGLMTLVNAKKEMIVFQAPSKDKNLRTDYDAVSFFDKEVAAAAEAALKAASLVSKRKSQGVIGGVIKEIKGGLLKSPRNGKEISMESHGLDCLSKIFMVPVSMQNLESPQVEQNCPSEITDSLIELDIDEEKVSDPAEERKKLFDGDDDNNKPVLRSPDEIRAKYGRAPRDVASAAGQARDKLLERHEKLQALGKRTEELQDDAQNFAAMAAELARTMEGKKTHGRKWWQL